ncbi:hypothetical protein GF407_17575 [candidate division KSB1 bacterium]|nr:hypothetical protein [candidate division KSB1 bacterium]
MLPLIFKIFKYIYQMDASKIIGIEHGNSIPGKEGEKAVINAYIAADGL